MKRNQKLRVESGEEGLRLDRYLRTVFPDVPSRSVRLALEAGAVRVDGSRAAKGRALRSGETVVVEALAEAEDWLPVPGDVPGAAVAYSDGHVAVLCKPADVHTEPQRPNEAGTLAGFLREIHPHVVRIASGPGLTLLTRLDYATSGAVPAALTKEAFDALRREREVGRIEKIYLCLVEGEVGSSLEIDRRIESEGGGTVRVRKELREPDCRRWTRIEPVRAQGGRTLVRARISTGKRHQIRAHLASAGHPIVGDRRYGAVPGGEPGHSRLMLHAETVVFPHPGTGERISVACPAPPEFELL